MAQATNTDWADPAVATSFMSFLSADDFPLPFDLLDAQTVSAAVQADPSVPLPGPEAVAATRKRLAEQHDSDSSDDDEPKASTKESKRAKSDAASKKATREKARREKIKERFAELAALIDPGGEPKTDNPTILADAIKCVQQLRVENSQLKQLNKFLEERVAQYDRERGQQLYQQMLQGHMVPGMMPPGLMGGSSLQSAGSMPGPSNLHAGGPSNPQPMMNPAMHAASLAALAAAAQHQPMMQPGAASVQAAMGGFGGMLPTVTHPGLSSTPAPPGDTKQEGLQQLGPGAAAQGAVPPMLHVPNMTGGKGLLGMTHPMGLPGVTVGSPPLMQQGWAAPPMLDSQRDAQLRPPAA